MSKTIPESANVCSDCILGIDSSTKHSEDGSKCASCASSGVDFFDCYVAVDGSDDNNDECSVDKNVRSYFEAVANSDAVKCDLESLFRLWRPYFSRKTKHFPVKVKTNLFRALAKTSTKFSQVLYCAEIL